MCNFQLIQFHGKRAARLKPSREQGDGASGGERGVLVAADGGDLRREQAGLVRAVADANPDTVFSV